MGPSPCVTRQIVSDCCGCLVWTLAPFLVRFAVFSRWRYANLGDLRVVFFVLVLLFCCVIRFAAFLMRPLCFMLNFKFVCLLIPMLGESQSDIGHKREKNPFCSMTVPKSGTSMVDLRLMCGRLHCHVSAARSPRLATSAKASKLGCSRRGGHLL